MDLRFEVLGPVRAWRGDTEVNLGSPQQRAVLAFLLLREGAAASPDELIQATWGVDAPRAAIGMVRSYVSRLRGVLGPVIQSVAHGYALPAPALDLSEFQRRILLAKAGDAASRAAGLRAALALWKGTPLSGVRSEYADAERVRLTEMRLAAIEDLAAADIEAGRHGEAAADLAAMVSEHPFRERSRELLMLALYRSGRQADALTVFEETRRVLSDELGIDPGPELREMHQRILVGDPALAPLATVGLRPAQLPPDLLYWTGRTDTLPGVLDALKSPNIPVVGLIGLAGVGKTALAIHAGHAVAADFPDGQLFVNMNSTPDPLAWLLRAVGVSDVPATLSEQSALWRTVTTGRRMLVVLDDVRDPSVVEPMLPGAGVAMLVTSRRRWFEMSCAHWVKLEGLRETETIALLERIVGAARLRAEPSATRQLAYDTAGLPQAVLAVGARLAERPNWTIARARERFHDRSPASAIRPPECQRIEQPYESALRDLTPAQARAFRLAALADTDLSLEAGAAMLDVSVSDAENLLEALVDLHLMEFTALEQYSYQHPVRVFARGHALLDDGRIESEAALARLAAFREMSAGLPIMDTRVGGPRP